MFNYNDLKKGYSMFSFSKASLLLLVVCTSLAPRAFSQTPPPAIFYSDLDGGPNVGGENNGGAYVTLYGDYFGASGTVSIGGVKAAVYKQWGAPWLWYQKISFQVPPTAAQGATSITVTNANGTSNSIPFNIQAGKIYFVATSGSDGNAGSSGSPWQTMSKCRQTLAPGDICYVENGVTQTSDDYNAALILGSPGTASAYKAIVVYPGQTATIGTDAGDRGIYPCSGYSDCPGGGNYWVVAGFDIRGSEAVYMSSVHDLKFVANKVQCPNGNGPTACFGAGEGQNYRVYGNEVTNAGVANASKTYHSMYFSTDANNVDIGWGSVHDSNGCRGIQFHSTSGNDQFGLSVHDNMIYNIRCDGINFATVDPSKGKVEAYNNLIFNAGRGPDPSDGSANYSCIYIPAFTNAGPSGSGAVQIYNNTLYNCGTWDQQYGGAVTTDTSSAVSTTLRNNAIRQDNGRRYLGSGTNLSRVNGSNNLYFGSGSGPAQTTGNLNADPKLAGINVNNFQLQAGSPAIDAGIVIAGLTHDVNGVSRPQGKANDIGAFEYFQGQAGNGGGVQPPPKPSCDLNSDGVVNQADVQEAVDQTIGKSPCGSADLQQNGTCNVVDVQRVVNASLGQACKVGP